MRHPYSDRTKEEIIALVEVYLPIDGTDWGPICRDVIAWFEERAKDDSLGAHEWSAWRACDPVHIAVWAVQTKGREYWYGVQKGWCELLFTLHKRRMEQFLSKKKLERLGGAG